MIPLQARGASLYGFDGEEKKEFFCSIHADAESASC